MTNIDNKPNLFHWATSELSQDAFICWLLSWSNCNINQELQKTSKYFIQRLTEGKIKQFQNLDVRRQVNNIDILCVIDNEYAILIEDKTNTKNHSNQLEKYLTELEKTFIREKIFPVYLKTGDQSNFSSIIEAGYSLFLRNDFLEVLDYGINIGVEDSIFVDFFNNLSSIENSVQSFKTLPVEQWHWDSWKGFYSELQKHLGSGEWDYVPQKNGGFLGFWWHWNSGNHNNNEYEYYLQLEHNKFCFKLYSYNKEKAREVRDYYRSLLYPKAAAHNIEIHQNGRIGSYMTVAALSTPYIAINDIGVLDMTRTVKTLKKIQLMIDEI